jgi:Putative inner membrane protein (DUF1819)
VARDTYAANLQNVGLVLDETETLLAAFVEAQDWQEVRRRALDDNLLGKRSTTTVRHILKVIRRRYLEPPSWLPTPDLVGRFFSRPPVSARAKTQVAFLYVLAEDRLVREAIQTLVLDPLPAHLHLEEALGFLRGLEREHATVAGWQPYLRRRWSSGLLTLLREVGFLDSSPSSPVRKPIVQPSAFALIACWLVAHTPTRRAGLDHDAFRYWALDDSERSALLRAGNERGWWTYAAAGGLLEFTPAFGSLEELIGALE